MQTDVFDFELMWAYDHIYVARLRCRPCTMEWNDHLMTHVIKGNHDESCDQRQPFVRLVEDIRYDADVRDHELVYRDFQQVMTNEDDDRTVYYAPYHNTWKWFPINKSARLLDELNQSYMIYPWLTTLRLGRIESSGERWTQDDHDAHDGWTEGQDYMAHLFTLETNKQEHNK